MQFQTTENRTGNSKIPASRVSVLRGQEIRILKVQLS
jgi:hypothetical protein